MRLCPRSPADHRPHRFGPDLTTPDLQEGVGVEEAGAYILRCRTVAGAGGGQTNKKRDNSESQQKLSANLSVRIPAQPGLAWLGLFGFFLSNCFVLRLVLSRHVWTFLPGMQLQ